MGRRKLGLNVLYLVQAIFTFVAALQIWHYTSLNALVRPIKMMKRGPFSSLNQAFDMVYVKNADTSLEKLLSVDKQLRTYNITYKVMRATTGSNTAVAAMYDEYRKRPLGKLQVFPEYSDREVSRGYHLMESAASFGYIYTMLDVLADAQKNKFKKILVLDDDILLCNDFQDRVGAFFSTIGPNWRILQLGASQYDWTSVDETWAMKNGYYQPRLFHTYGSFALGLDRSIFEEVATIARSLESPFDMLPLGNMYERYIGQCYVAFPNLFIADVRQSMIRGHRDQVIHSQRMKWRLHDFPFPPPRPTIGLILHSSKLFNVPQDVFDDHSIDNNGPFILNLYCSSTMDGIRPLYDLARECNGLETPGIECASSLTSDFLAIIHKESLPIGYDDITYYLRTYMDPTLPKSKVLKPLAPNQNCESQRTW